MEGDDNEEGNDEEETIDDRGAGAICLASALLSAWLNETPATAGSGPQTEDGNA